MLAHHHHVFEQVYLVLDVPDSMERDESAFKYFGIDGELQYHSFCDDFGPMNLSSVYRFCQTLGTRLHAQDERLLGLTVSCDGPSLTNAVFLLGAFMIMELGQGPTTVKDTFQGVAHLLLSYRDISPGPQNFELHLQDCWDALHKARELEWIDLGPDGFDCDEYDHYDNPRNADMHFVVPNKIIAMKGPSTLENGQRWQDTPDGSRNFSVDHYAELLHDFDVQLVIRLNQPEYSDDEYIQRDIAVAGLFFEDCTLPPNDIVVKFLLVIENLPGAVAVHCKAGLGRTGTLIALYLMKNFGFTARQAIGWLRIVRPGSIIGRQQQYLCDVEPSIARLRGHPLTGPFAAPAAAPPANVRGAADVGRVVTRICARVDEGQRLSETRTSAPNRTPSAPPQQSGFRDQQLAVHVNQSTGRRNSLRMLLPYHPSGVDEH